MADTVAPRARFGALAPGKPERPLVLAAAPVMNAQALLDDIRKFNARQAQVERATAAERMRFDQAICSVLVALCESIAATERKHA